MTIEEFVAQVTKRELPANPMAQIQTLARELAEGAANRLWPITFDGLAIFNEGRLANRPQEQLIRRYLDARWQLDNESLGQLFNLLIANGYLTYAREPERFVLDYTISKEAFDLLHTAQAAQIFISYKRTESSAFALLVANVLRNAGLEPFVDIQLKVGDAWRAELKYSVETADYLILLLGKETLKSEVTLEEITWAIDAGTIVIPIWHNQFAFNAAEWAMIPATIQQTLNDAHAIRVTEENPLAYNTALTELLNRFGVTR